MNIVSVLIEHIRQVYSDIINYPFYVWTCLLRAFACRTWSFTHPMYKRNTYLQYNTRLTHFLFYSCRYRWRTRVRVDQQFLRSDGGRSSYRHGSHAVHVRGLQSDRRHRTRRLRQQRGFGLCLGHSQPMVVKVVMDNISGIPTKTLGEILGQKTLKV